MPPEGRVIVQIQDGGQGDTTPNLRGGGKLQPRKNFVHEVRKNREDSVIDLGQGVRSC